MVAVERYVEAYRAFAANGAAGAPAWLTQLRDGGIARFGELGFPTTKQEAWRFTSTAAIAETDFELAHPASRIPHPDAIEPFLLGAGPRLVFVNGHFSSTLSRVAGLPAGVRVESLAQAFVIVTHYQRLLNYITPDVVHVLADGRIVKSGGPELAHELEAKGYDWLRAGAMVS